MNINFSPIIRIYPCKFDSKAPKFKKFRLTQAHLVCITMINETQFGIVVGNIYLIYIHSQIYMYSCICMYMGKIHLCFKLGSRISCIYLYISMITNALHLKVFHLTSTTFKIIISLFLSFVGLRA